MGALAALAHAPIAGRRPDQQAADVSDAMPFGERRERLPAGPAEPRRSGQRPHELGQRGQVDACVGERHLRRPAPWRTSPASPNSTTSASA
jgi:hypothetical protein